MTLKSNSTGISKSKAACWAALACLVVPMFASYFFDDMFSTLSHIFQNPAMLELGWNSADYGFYAGGYSFLCVCGGLVICGVLLDMFGVRLVGSIFVGLMVLGAVIVFAALVSGLPPESSLTIAYIGCMIFGLGSEIAGVAVTRSIAKWFKGRNVALAMGLQLSIARLGTAAAFLLAPVIVAQKPAGEIYGLMETARPAMVGLGLLLWTYNILGDGAEFEAWWETMKENALTIADGWSSAYGLFTEGEAPIVLSYTTSPVYHVMNEDTTRFQALVFPEGHEATIEGIGIVKGTDMREEAERFVDFILTEAQLDIAIANSMYPANGAIELPSAFDYAPKPEILFRSGATSPEKTEELQEAWLAIMTD